MGGEYIASQALLGKESRQLRQMDQQVIQEWKGTKDRRVSGECPQLWKGNGGKDRLVVLTTPQSYDRHVANALECEATVEDASDEARERVCANTDSRCWQVCQYPPPTPPFYNIPCAGTGVTAGAPPADTDCDQPAALGPR